MAKKLVRFDWAMKKMLRHTGEAREETKEESQKEAILGLYENGVLIPIIAKSLKMTEDKVRQIIETMKG